MTAWQLRQMVANRRRGGPVSLFAPERLAGLLETAARRAQRTEDAVAAWQRVAEPEWLEQTQVLDFADGVLRVATADAAIRFELTRRQGALQRALSAYLPGLRQLRLLPAGRM